MLPVYRMDRVSSTNIHQWYCYRYHYECRRRCRRVGVPCDNIYTSPVIRCRNSSRWTVRRLGVILIRDYRWMGSLIYSNALEGLSLKTVPLPSFCSVLMSLPYVGFPRLGPTSSKTSVWEPLNKFLEDHLSSLLGVRRVISHLRLIVPTGLWSPLPPSMNKILSTTRSSVSVVPGLVCRLVSCLGNQRTVVCPEYRSSFSEVKP